MTKRELVDAIKDCPDDMPVLLDDGCTTFHATVSVTSYGAEDAPESVIIIGHLGVEISDDEIEEWS